MKKPFVLLLAVFVFATTQVTGAEEKASDPVNPRNKVFSLQPSDIGISKGNYPDPVWGLVMETGLKVEARLKEY